MWFDRTLPMTQTVNRHSGSVKWHLSSVKWHLSSVNRHFENSFSLISKTVTILCEIITYVSLNSTNFASPKDRNMVSTNEISPVKTSERFIILDALRGFALLGICMANFPEFSLYTFLSSEATASMPTAIADKITRYLLYFFVDGKFYTLFSLLFGIGFSIIIRNTERKGVNGFRIFYRRMGMLLLFGFLHLMFIWSGDILMLYALLGILLPLFRRISDKKLLGWALFFLILPIAVDGVCEMTCTNLALPFIRLQEAYCAEYVARYSSFLCKGLASGCRSSSLGTAISKSWDCSL